MNPNGHLLTPGPFALLLSLALFPTRAEAQLRGTWGVGVGVGKVHTTASDLKSNLTVQPVFGRLPSQGWGYAFAFNWFSADVDATDLGVEEKLGRVAFRPIMFGVAHTTTWGKLAVAPNLVAGPSVNTLKIDDRWDGRFELEGSGFERRVGSIGFAVRPGVTAVYALAPRVGLSAFGGYLFNRPSFDIDTPSGTVKTKWDADGVVVTAGVIVTF